DVPPPASTAPVSDFRPGSYARRGRLVRPARVLLVPENSLALREQLIAELGAFRDTDALTVWAARILAQKNQLATSDAQALEAAFAVKLGELEGDRPGEKTAVAIGEHIEPADSESSGSARVAAGPQDTPSPERNGRQRPPR